MQHLLVHILIPALVISIKEERNLVLVAVFLNLCSSIIGVQMRLEVASLLIGADNVGDRCLLTLDGLVLLRGDANSAILLTVIQSTAGRQVSRLFLGGLDHCGSWVREGLGF